MNRGVTVAYSGVHQAFQLALAAQEVGALDAFLCSIYAAPGKWGGRLARLLGAQTLINRRLDGLDVKKVHEYPWPLVAHYVRTRLQPVKANDWLTANDRFDRWAARHLEQSSSRVFVGVETCCEHSLQTARRRGIKTVLDCPQLHPAFLSPLLAEAADRAGLRTRPSVDVAEMAERKTIEYAIADRLLLYSDVHRRSFREAGFGEERLFDCPLWVDPTLWYPTPDSKPQETGPLKVLFVGGISLRKGVPFLLDAVLKLGALVQLTLVGAVHPELQVLLAQRSHAFEQVPPQPKRALREIYITHHVLVLPSLGDSFGFVGLEAMACGLPVIVTENCGVPVPDASWRVPVMNSDAIAARLEVYSRDRERLRTDCARAVEFARQFSPQRYREQIGTKLAKWSGQAARA